MKNYLGEFEELVLLTVSMLGDEAYGVAIKDALQAKADRTITIGSLHSTIARLEEKGLLESWLGEATAVRGGRKKRYFRLTADAVQVLQHIKSLRDELWGLSNISIEPI
jgi:PadR family transcriptional regulator, regulatory protein PadR